MRTSEGEVVWEAESRRRLMLVSCVRLCGRVGM